MLQTGLKGTMSRNFRPFLGPKNCTWPHMNMHKRFREIFLLLSSMYVTKFSTISFYLTKLYVTLSFAIASSVTYSEIRQNLFKSEQGAHGQNGGANTARPPTFHTPA